MFENFCNEDETIQANEQTNAQMGENGNHACLDAKTITINHKGDAYTGTRTRSQAGKQTSIKFVNKQNRSTEFQRVISF